MPNRHFQSRAVFTAEDAVRRPGSMPWSAATALIRRVCKEYDIPVPALFPASDLIVDGTLILPKRPRPVTILHALAHELTDPVFPPHGAEFCGRWIELYERYCNLIFLRDRLDELGVHHTADKRVDTMRRAAVYLVNNKPGVTRDVILDEPPERGRGSIESFEDDELRIGGRVIPLSRCRYMHKVPPS